MFNSMYFEIFSIAEPSINDAFATNRHARESGYPGFCNRLKFLDSRIRGNDANERFRLFTKSSINERLLVLPVQLRNEFDAYPLGACRLAFIVI